MPVYFFTHQTSNAHIKDPDGTKLEELATWEYARQVARELMKRREPQSRPWRIDVPDSRGRQGFEVLFASVDDIFAALGDELRGLIENIHRKQASLIGAITAVRLLLA